MFVPPLDTSPPPHIPGLKPYPNVMMVFGGGVLGGNLG